ncbi:Polysaccharide biosynthesis protein involved in cell wall biogenesis [Elusimicrobium minutum Pei191]|uniref:Polysaccharide biosynthesis protein involved in cell wall biogenesis n=1 Tax=Elusimicrobium minutum (strain Pei191) TaxID=445932 RepID=B2KC33_ELUMP|nr:oligosaccharide flippase family protein [Elusimicrobium minutum]ACC98160.1 Polysaccharide biosynthesis protein involved in cell wall biogenesis [Elusimicrobium minutum Pei191]
MKLIKKLGQETLIYGTSTIIARLLNFCLVPLYTYFLVTSEYGIVAAVFSFLALFNVIYQYGMDQAYLRFTSDHQQDKEESFSTAYFSVLCTSVLLSLLIVCTAPLWAKLIGIGPYFSYLIKLSAAVLFLDALTVIPFAKLRLQHRAWRFVTVRTTAIVTNVAFNIYFLATTSYGVKGIFYASIIASSAALLLLLPVIKEDLRLKFSKELLRKMLKFAWPFVPSGMASILVNVIDKPLLVFLTGLSAVGVYQANFKIGVFMMLIVSMFDQAWRPFFLQHAKEPYAKPLFAQVLNYFTAFSMWVALGLGFLMPVIIRTPIFGHYFIHPNYWYGLNIIPFVMAGYFFYGIYINFIVAPVITKKTGILMYATILGAIVSVATNIFLVPKVGLLGAGSAIMLSYISMAVTMFIFTQKNYPIPYQYNKLLALALTGTLAIAANCYFNTLTAKIVILILFPLIAFKIVYVKKDFFDHVTIK